MKYAHLVQGFMNLIWIKILLLQIRFFAQLKKEHFCSFGQNWFPNNLMLYKSESESILEFTHMCTLE